MVKSPKYRGWNITYSSSRPETGKYVAESYGVTLSARNRVEIERMVDQRIRDYPPDGHGGPYVFRSIPFVNENKYE